MVDDADQLKKHPSVLQLYTSAVRLKRNGKELEGLCPLHAEGTPSFKLRQAADGTYLWNCFGCDQQGGNIFQFLQKLNKISFNQAVSIVRKHVEGSWTGTKEVVEQTFKPLGLENKPKRVYTSDEYRALETALANNSPAREYLLRERGITYETAKSLRFGYRQSLLYQDKKTGATGCYGGEGNLPVGDKGWIAFPHIRDGKIVGIKYRSIAGKFMARQPGMDVWLFNADDVDMLEPVFLVEGEYDTACLKQMGAKVVSIDNAQQQITPEMKDRLLEAEYVVLAGDNDDAGRKAMEKLWAEMKERTYFLQWPAGIKDANAFWDSCGRDLSVFRTKIDALVQEAKSRPMAGIYSLQESLMNNTEENVKDDPNRFRFSLPSVDRMAIISPGSVVGLMATSTGQGKTTFVLQETLESARKYGEVVLNYQAELTIEQVARIVTAHTLRKHRLELTKQDMQDAARMLGSAKYYVGRNATLTTITPVLDLIEAAIRRLSPTVVVLDNIHYLVRNETDQVKAMENAMQRIKSLAVLYKLKFFVLGAPKKAESTAKGKQLHVSDARGSITFGDDSDAVFTIHRDMLTNTDDKKNDYSPQTRLRLVKVRDKGPGDAEVDLIFVGEIATFAEAVYNQEPSMFQ